MHKSTSERLGEALKQAQRHWQRQPQAEPVLPAGATPPAPRHFTITVSREAGAKGPTIARAVGEKLGWAVYDHELLERIASEMGLRARLLESLDEKRESWLRQCLQSFSSAPVVDENTYVHRLVEMLLSLAGLGECVIVGRGAAQVLPAATTLRVRLVGPVADRITAIEQKFGIPREEAVRWVEKTDHDRTQFVRTHFQKDPTDPRHYDLVLNSCRLRVPECAELIVTALRQFQSRSLAAATTPATQLQPS